MRSIAAFISVLLLLACVQLLHAQNFYDTSVENSWAKENVFLSKSRSELNLMDFKKFKAQLPVPMWKAREDVLSCYWKAWELAYKNIKTATWENKFISPFISPAFNNHIFMWDTSFMVMFGRYGRRVFDFQGSLDNFYKNQHKDGYICREISELDGSEIFSKYDPSSTGPNIMPWAEWDYFQYYKDKGRLTTVFPVLLGYYRWFQQNRSWKDGSYFSTGWGCGMDNQPRLQAGYNPEFSHGFMSWIDTNLQQLFAAEILIKMSDVLGRENEIKDIRLEVQKLKTYVQQHMWDENTGYFYDRYRDGSLSGIKSIAAYWALLAEAVPQNQLQHFIDHLENPAEFARVHRVPTLSADTKGYSPDGNYWQGGVWAPTTYMVLRGLTKYKQDSLAFEIAMNHLNNVVRVYKQTGTLWENYAPDKIQGRYRKDLVGWTGLVPISVLLEYVFGISQDREDHILVWDIRLLDEFGVRSYPLPNDGFANLSCAKRSNFTDRPKVKITSSVPLTLKLIWSGGEKIIHVAPSSLGSHRSVQR